MLRKCIWALRCIFLKPFLNKCGSFSYIGKPLLIKGMRNISIGNKVRIYPGCRIETYDDGFIDIQDNVSIGQNFHCTSNGKLIIGKNTTITGDVVITNIDHDYRNIGVHILKQNRIISETEIGDNCFIGYGAAILPGTKLGKQCVVGTNAVVRGEFPDYCVIVGVPAKIVKKYNTITNEWEEYGK